MRPWRHLTPRYMLDRLAEIGYRRTHPHTPWLTPTANTLLTLYLKPGDQALEFGSGRSTLWFAQRVARLTSVEHDEQWYKRTQERLQVSGLNNVTYLHYPLDRPENEGHAAAYVQVAERFAPGSLDFVLVDGVYRAACALAARERIRPGGLLAIDNVNWFLPSATRSPSSRALAQGPLSAEWAEVAEALRAWRCLWTSSGVTDTALFFKPC